MRDVLCRIDRFENDLQARGLDMNVFRHGESFSVPACDVQRKIRIECWGPIPNCDRWGNTPLPPKPISGPLTPDQPRIRDPAISAYLPGETLKGVSKLRKSMPEAAAFDAPDSPQMKIASFNINNINNINRRVANLVGWLRECGPDVVCLQGDQDHGRRVPGGGYSQGRLSCGVVWREALERRGHPRPLGADRHPNAPAQRSGTQCRYIEAAVNGVLIASIYAPNGNPQPGPKFDFKLAWLERFADHASELYATGAPVVLAGDYNVVPTSLDIYPTKSWDRDALLQPESRAAYRRLLDQGGIDAVRQLHPKEPMWTFWGYMRNRWERDGGLRLDHLLLSPAALERLQDAGVDRQVRGLEGASDHAPVWLTLSATPKRGGGNKPVRRAPKSEIMSSSKSRGTTKPTSRKADETDPAPRKRRGGGSGRPLLVIDGDSFAHRSYHALPKTIRRSDGKAVGAIVGFANLLLRAFANERPRAVVVGWDTLEKPTQRKLMFPAYQSGREFDAELIEQLGVLPEFVSACGFANATAAGFEADDFLAAAVAAEEGAGGITIVASGDRDSFQLASERTTIVYPVRGGESVRIGPAEVRERYGVDPKQVPDFIALRGDPSDKLPGATGVGPKRAAQLLRRYGTLDGVLDAGFFAVEADKLRLYRRIATMDVSAPLPSLSDQTPTWLSAAKLATSWGLNALAERLSEIVG